MDKIYGFGKISSVDYQSGKADIILEDEEEAVLTGLPFFSSEYKMPLVGDSVVILFQDAKKRNRGIIMGSLFNSQRLPEADGEGVYFKRLSEDAYIRYDPLTETLEVSAPKVVIHNLQ